MTEPAILIGPDGVPEMVDLALCRAPTKRRPPPRQVLRELRIAHEQSRRTR